MSEDKLQAVVDFQNDRVRNELVRARRTGKPVHVHNLCLVLDNIGCQCGDDQLPGIRCYFFGAVCRDS